jgi:hypothetical protein
MKICLISFDAWNYDHHIIKTLRKKGVEANHINLRNFKYTHPTYFHRIKNFFNKFFFKKNIRKIKKKSYPIEELEILGTQDQILIINPETISLEIHQKIKNFTKRYIAYLYDSNKRNPVEHLLKTNLFDTIFSFDDEDVQQFNLKKLNNYIYFEKQHPIESEKIKYDVFTISSIDERLAILNKIAIQLTKRNSTFNFLLIGKSEPADKHEKINFSTKRKNQEEVHSLIKESNIVLDILREDQTGLSFRIFEAMGFQKKIITTNKHIKNYDFYNPNNILVINPENPKISKKFLEKPYEPLPENIYEKYTLDYWTEKIFNL